MEHGRCPCGGTYGTRFVEVRMKTADGEPIDMANVPQGACPTCGSRVYKTQVLDVIETLFHYPEKR